MTISSSRQGQGIAALSLGRDDLAGIVLLIYFSSSIISAAFRYPLSWISLESFRQDAVAFIFIVAILIFIFISKKPLPADFIYIFAFVVVFFLLTYLLNPHYGYVYFREQFGVWDHVFRPTNGIYAYLVIRLFHDPQKIVKYLKVTAILQFIFLIAQYYMATQRGYWTVTRGPDLIVERGYSLTFGYDMLFVTLVFLYYGIIENNKKLLLLSMVGIGYIFTAGSRGPFIGLVIFCVLMFLKHLRTTKRNVAIVFFLSGCAVLFFIYLDQILEGFIYWLNSLNVASRTLDMIINNVLLEQVSGRDLLWSTTIAKIYEQPLWGYGFLGERHFLYPLYYGGYVHNIYLELLANFGVVLGSLIALYLLIGAIKMLISCHDKVWLGLFIIFFSMSTQLILSRSFWILPHFWASIAIVVSYNASIKKRS